MKSFDKTTVQFIHNLNFNTNVLKLVLVCITIFYVKMHGIKTMVDMTARNSIGFFSSNVIFRTLITQHQYQLPLIHTVIYIYGIQSRRKEVINFMLDV